METIIIAETPSTNTYISTHAESLPVPCVVRAIAQTAGRGQRGNTWEAAPGRNLTLSFLFRPEGIVPREQFAVSEAIALGVVDTLRHYGIVATVKWPNDIYVADRKICGILIEHSLYGMEIRRSVAGIGLNVNQTHFKSDAPNPVSMTMLTGREYDLTEVTDALADAVQRRLEMTAAPPGREALHADFMSRLWRGDGRAWPFRQTSDGAVFRAVIADISPEGYLTLHPADGGAPRRYAFKEVAFLP